MAQHDFIPQNDGEFDTVQDRFVGAVAGSPAKFGLTTDDVTALQTAQAAWSAAYPAHIKARQASETAAKTKDEARADLEKTMRGLAKKVHGTPGMTNATRAEAGLAARSGTRSSVGAPDTRPLGRIEAKGHSTLVVHFVDETTPTRLAKPEGVQGCQIFSFIGDAAPADPSGYAFVALDTRTPYVDEHAAANAGKIVHYLLRWQNAKGDTGPWSAVITAKIPTR